MSANDDLYCQYGDQDGGIEHPDMPIPFADVPRYLGPLAHYVDLFQAAYDTEEAEASLDFLAVCFVVLEAETGIQFTMELVNDIQQVLPAAAIDARS